MRDTACRCLHTRDVVTDANCYRHVENFGVLSGHAAASRWRLDSAIRKMQANLFIDRHQRPSTAPRHADSCHIVEKVQILSALFRRRCVSGVSLEIVFNHRTFFGLIERPNRGVLNRLLVKLDSGSLVEMSLPLSEVSSFARLIFLILGCSLASTSTRVRLFEGRMESLSCRASPETARWHRMCSGTAFTHHASSKARLHACGRFARLNCELLHCSRPSVLASLLSNCFVEVLSEMSNGTGWRTLGQGTWRVDEHITLARDARADALHPDCEM